MILCQASIIFTTTRNETSISFNIAIMCVCDVCVRTNMQKLWRQLWSQFLVLSSYFVGREAFEASHFNCGAILLPMLPLLRQSLAMHARLHLNSGLSPSFSLPSTGTMGLHQPLCWLAHAVCQAVLSHEWIFGLNIGPCR